MTNEQDNDPLVGMSMGKVMDIAEDPDHPLHDVAVQRLAPVSEAVAEQVGKMYASLAETIAPVVAQQTRAAKAMDALRGVMQTPDWGDMMRDAREASLRGPLVALSEPMDLTPISNPMFDVLDETRKSNELNAELLQTMAEMLDVAKQDAAAARADAEATREADAAARAEAKAERRRWFVGQIIAILAMVVTAAATVGAAVYFSGR